MRTEYEIRVLEINTETIIDKIKKIGAEFIGEYFQKRYVYDFIPVQKGKWIRLRDNGEKCTLAIKEIINKEIDGTKELEIEVSNFADTNEILRKLGYIHRSYQENRRVEFRYENIVLDIDSWPMIPTYLEIEGSSEDAIKNMLNMLELNDDQITTLGVDDIYRDVYGIELMKIQNLQFSD